MIVFIKKLSSGEHLTIEESRRAMSMIMGGEATPAQVAAYLTALSIKGPTPDEVAGAAIVMREKATRIDVSGLAVIDTCGTGGTGKKAFNVSTCAALVAAGAGAYVAKHGNRGATSKCGSSDVLEALGVNVDADPTTVARCVRECRIGFLFAPRLHAAMKYAVPVRKEIGIRTIFNVLGPLTNPAGARRQVMGVFAPELVPMIAEVMAILDVEHAMVVHASDGLDEITLAGPTRVAEVRGGEVREFQLRPEDLGLPEVVTLGGPLESAEQGAEMVREVLVGKQGGRRDTVLANAAAALYVSGLAANLQAGIKRAAESIDSGAAARTLDALAECSSGG